MAAPTTTARLELLFFFTRVSRLLIVKTSPDTQSENSV